MVIPEMWRDCGRESADEAMHLFLRSLIAGGSVIAREARQVLSEAVTGCQAVIARLVEVAEGRPTVPPAHIVAWRRQACALPKRLQKGVFIEREIKCVGPVELLAHWPFQQLDIAITELPERRHNLRRIV